MIWLTFKFCHNFSYNIFQLRTSLIVLLNNYAQEVNSTADAKLLVAGLQYATEVVDQVSFTSMVRLVSERYAEEINICHSFSFFGSETETEREREREKKSGSCFCSCIRDQNNRSILLLCNLVDPSLAINPFSCFNFFITTLLLKIQ